MLRIHGTSLELLRDCMPVARAIARHDEDLARQLRRALTSVPLNISEGTDQKGGRREQHYRYAIGSAREAFSAVQAAEAAGYIERPSDALVNTFNTVIGTLCRCIHPRTAA